MVGLRRGLRLLAYPLFRARGFPHVLPMNLTVSVIYSCSSRCATCHVWKKRADNLTPAEYAKVFRSLGHAPVWVTVSGGDQFLRQDLPEIMRLACAIMRPAVINLPMNGILTKRIAAQLPEIARVTVGSKLILNLSIDEIGARHDELRGYAGNYDKILDTYRIARELQRTYTHVVVGIHTVISRLNAARVPAIYEELRALAPDSYITEIAEERVELGTIGSPITPDAAEYGAAVDYLKDRIRERRSTHPVGRFVEAFRLEYYDLVKRTLRERTQVIPCYAGWASAHLAPDGEVWGCCVRAESFGNVRESDYDFGRVWRSAQGGEFRRSVRAKECACPLANAAYTNMLLSPSALRRVAANLV